MLSAGSMMAFGNVAHSQPASAPAPGRPSRRPIAASGKTTVAHATIFSNAAAANAPKV
ncbi:MAG TPA: hypothetical protein VE996_14585 [Terriglobales bacterium]|nr:hypothetical protein [Terriglobales bacterium]